MNRGTCLCGAVSYEVDGPYPYMSHCHCSMCRKHHGSMFATYVAAPVAGFRWTSGEASIVNHPSSAQGKRSFCPACGSVTPAFATELGAVFVPAGNLLGELGIRPQHHIFVGSKAPWYTITDELPQHEKFSPPYEAPDVPRPEVSAKPGVTQGSCLCGDVAFEYHVAPKRSMHCHCSRCRLSRGAAHATNSLVSSESFRWTRGAAQLTRFDLAGARFFGTTFCKRCGSTAPHEIPAIAAYMIPCGALDTDPGAGPSGHVFAASKAEWFDITDDVPQFAEMPPSP